LGLRDSGKAVGAGGDEEGGVVLAGVVEVEAEGEHPLQNLERRDDVVDAGFVRPVGEAGSVDAGADGDGAVLMPAQRPVPLGRFLEEDGSDWAGGGAEELAGDFVRSPEEVA
jgi:hypothetical protein